MKTIVTSCYSCFSDAFAITRSSLRCGRLMLTAAVIAGLLPGFALAQADNEQVDVATAESTTLSVPKDLSLRVRIVAMDPAEPTTIQWRHGGEGMGGDVIKGAMSLPADALPAVREEPARNTKPGTNPESLFKPGQWSAPMPIASFVSSNWPSRLFVTFWVGRPPKPTSLTDRTPVNYVKGVKIEFEVSYQKKVIKTITESAADGGTVTLLIWPQRWAGQAQPDLSAGVMGLLEYVTSRAAQLEALPWGKEGSPKKFAIVTDLGGYGLGSGYGIHHCSPEVVEAETRTLRQLGVNALRAVPSNLVPSIIEGKGPGAQFSRARIVQVPGYPVVPAPRKKNEDLEPGCPFSEKVPSLTDDAMQRTLEELRTAGTPEVWGLTVDEIGVVFDHTNLGKQHVEQCPRCIGKYVEFLKARNIKSQDVGSAQWSDVRPCVKPAKENAAAWLKDAGSALNAYYTRLFIAETSAAMFTPVRSAVAKANDEKQKAPKDAPAATQPVMRTYALRGNTFLLGGHSLDFFDFYRRSDNGFVYETSNRDVRVHQWDSYLCDVGRMVSQENSLALGVYVKPHRGSVVQRAMTAISRGAGMLFWYTFGPDYNKGDCFSANPAQLELTSKAAHLIAKTEDRLYGAKLVSPATIGVVKPNTTEVWLGLTGRDPAWAASWENAKWTYTALAHEHLPCDPLDERMIEERDLSGYQVLYVSGPNLRSAAATKLAQWVERGGTLCVSGWSVARDEANRPLQALWPMLGLASRGEPEMYLDVKTYAGGALTSFDITDPRKGFIAAAPDAAAISGDVPFDVKFKPKVGREPLKPTSDTKVLARFADGSAAITLHEHGKGRVYVMGFFPALEYSGAVRGAEFDMSTQFDAALRRSVTAPALTKASPVVDASVPTVEGVLLREPASGKRSVTLMNWTYRAAEQEEKKPSPATAKKGPRPTLVELKETTVTIHGAGPVTRVRSAMLDKDLPVQQKGQSIVVTVPLLQEADVLLLD